MHVRIGVTGKGQPVAFDTTSGRPLLLLGDAGRGKTTIARYLVRWWLADTGRHARVYARRPGEWADLSSQAASVRDRLYWAEHDLQSGRCLVVVDDLDLSDVIPAGVGPRRAARLILTGRDASHVDGAVPAGVGADCLGLVSQAVWDPAELAVLDGQGRLDWPADTVAVVPDQRGPLDFPCHRWHTPVTELAAADPAPRGWLAREWVKSDLSAPERPARARATQARVARVGVARIRAAGAGA